MGKKKQARKADKARQAVIDAQLSVLNKRADEEETEKDALFRKEAEKARKKNAKDRGFGRFLAEGFNPAHVVAYANQPWSNPTHDVIGDIADAAAPGGLAGVPVAQVLTPRQEELIDGIVDRAEHLNKLRDDATTHWPNPRPWHQTMNVAGFAGYEGIYDGLPEQSVISEETIAKHDDVLRRNAGIKTHPLDGTLADALKTNAEKSWLDDGSILPGLPSAVVVGMEGQKPIIIHVGENKEPDPVERAMSKIQEAAKVMQKKHFEIDEDALRKVSPDAVGVNDQPEPKPNDNESVHDLVVKDVLQRKDFGLEKYGTILQAGNLRDAIKDSYEEILDHVCYMRAYLEETKDAVVLPRSFVTEVVNALKVGRDVALEALRHEEEDGEVDDEDKARADAEQIGHWIRMVNAALDPERPASQPDQQV